ncbi:PAS domain S-box protein [Thermodesulfobacteriota bacterium]
MTHQLNNTPHLDEKALTQDDELYKSLFEESSSIMVIVDPETGEIKAANKRAIEFYGYSRAELTSMKSMDINTLPADALLHKMQQTEKQSGNYHHFTHRLGNGEIRDVEVYSGPILLNGKKLLYSIIHDITERKKIEKEKEDLIIKLQKALDEIKTLQGILPICASCKSIRDDQGYWNQIECYFRDHSELHFSHGICPDCAKKLYPGYNLNDDKV